MGGGSGAELLPIPRCAIKILHEAMIRRRECADISSYSKVTCITSLEKGREGKLDSWVLGGFVDDSDGCYPHFHIPYHSISITHSPPIPPIPLIPLTIPFSIGNLQRGKGQGTRSIKKKKRNRRLSKTRVKANESPREIIRRSRIEQNRFKLIQISADSRVSHQFLQGRRLPIFHRTIQHPPPPRPHPPLPPSSHSPLSSSFFSSFPYSPSLSVLWPWTPSPFYHGLPHTPPRHKRKRKCIFFIIFVSIGIHPSSTSSFLPLFLFEPHRHRNLSCQRLHQHQ